jgi:NTE family protein
MKGKRLISDSSMVTRKKVGLALGGGAVRGLAHVGVLSELVAADIPIDYIAGTSAGSIIGSLFCSGIGLERMSALAEETNWWRIARLALSPRGFLNFNKLSGWLQKHIGDIDFSDLQVPFTAVAADIATGEEVDLSAGRLAPAVQASCSIPGIITPVEIDGRLLVDGSIVNTVPVNVVRRMGADYVIGVDILTHKVRWRLGPLGYGIAAIEILAEKAGMGAQQADCLITPDMAGKSYVRFSKRKELVQLGAWAARQRIDHIRRALGLIEPYADLIP